MKSLILDKKNVLSSVLLVLVTLVINNLIFSNQLNYGFRDVDWVMLYYFNFFDNLSLNHLLEAANFFGVYTYELYYVGFLEKFLGLNFVHLHQATQLFKIITAICLYILVLKIFKRKLLAILSSLMYTISYTHAGALFMLATGGYFLATIFMNLFLVAYYYAIVESKTLKWEIVTSFLLVLTLILNTERMYPLIPLVVLVEFFFLAFNKFKREQFVMFLRRTFFIFLPLIIFTLIYFFGFRSSTLNIGFKPDQFFIGIGMRTSSILNGNLQLLIYPFASLGSIFLYGDYWKFLGQVNVSSLSQYISFLIFGPILKLGIGTFFLFSFIYKRPFKLTSIIMAATFIFGLLIYTLFINWQNINSSMRIHFDLNLITIPAIFGFYIFILNCIFFISWFKNKDIKFFPLIAGLSFAILFIILTWIASDIQLLFMGPQRYLSIPSIGTSLFISGILVTIFDKLRKINVTKQFAWIIFLVLIPLMFINYQVANNFFNYELDYAGMRGKDQTKMKAKFRTLITDISRQDRSLFYFDETADKDNGYFNESTILAGFEFWTKFNARGEFEDFPGPGMLRTNIQCPEHTHENCIQILKEGLTKQNGVWGILYKDSIREELGQRFFKLSNFYAMRFVNKDIVDIKEEVIKELKKDE